MGRRKKHGKKVARAGRKKEEKSNRNQKSEGSETRGHPRSRTTKGQTGRITVGTRYGGKNGTEIGQYVSDNKSSDARLPRFFVLSLYLSPIRSLFLSLSLILSLSLSFSFSFSSASPLSLSSPFSLTSFLRMCCPYHFRNSQAKT